MRNIRGIVRKKIAIFTAHKLFGENIIEANTLRLYEYEGKVIVDIGKGETFCRKNDEEFCIKISKDEIYMKDSLMEIYIRIL